MLFKWFSTQEVDTFADSIIADLCERFPPRGADASSQKAAEKAMKTLDRVYVSIAGFAARARPNLYQKARFGNRIKWALRDAGYPEPFIDVATHELVKHLALSASARQRRE
jgi:hypothetical protein